MPHDTDERLRSRLDTNQLGREELCLGLLALDQRFSEIRPRHPRGGPDGGRDIDARFGGAQIAVAAVGFVNGANDSAAQKRRIRKKLADDASSAKVADTRPDVFVFMTNLALTMGEQDGLKQTALKLGFAGCEVFDRNLMRAMLDNPDGFALRFQYLGLPLSEAEQTSFFAKWGGGIQDLVTSSFQRVELTLERLLFLQEAGDVLSSLDVHLELDRAYPAAEIGHFRAFVRMFLREPKHKIYQLLFGASDRSMRFRSEVAEPWKEPSGIGEGISGGQWEMRLELTAGGDADVESTDEAETGAALPDDIDPDAHEEAWVACGSSSAVGVDPVSTIGLHYNHDGGLIRLFPRMTLRDLEDAGWIVLLNKSLAAKVVAMHVYANAYKLDEIRASDFSIESGPSETKAPLLFDPDELADPWARIRPKTASFFELRFNEKTPVRIFTSKRANSRMDYLRRRSQTADS